MTKQHRDVEKRHPRKQQLHRERIAEPVRVSVGDVRQLEQGAERPLPIGDSGFGLAVASPEDVILPLVIEQFERIHTRLRQRQDDRRPGLLSVEEQLAFADSFFPQRHRVTNPQPRPPKQ